MKPNPAGHKPDLPHSVREGDRVPRGRPRPAALQEMRETCRSPLVCRRASPHAGEGNRRTAGPASPFATVAPVGTALAGSG